MKPRQKQGISTEDLDLREKLKLFTEEQLKKSATQNSDPKIRFYISLEKINRLKKIPPEVYYRYLYIGALSLPKKLAWTKEAKAHIQVLMKNYKTQNKLLPLSSPFRNKMNECLALIWQQIIENKIPMEPGFLIIEKLIDCETLDQYKTLITDIKDNDSPSIKALENLLPTVEEAKKLGIIDNHQINDLDIESIQSLLVEQKSKINKDPQLKGGVDIVMDIDTKKIFADYLNKIKEAIRAKKISLESTYTSPCLIGEKLFLQLQAFVTLTDSYDIKSIDETRIDEMTIDDFIACLFKTAESDLSPEQSSALTKGWNEIEYQLLANSPKIVRGAKALTKTTYKPTSNDIIKENHPKFDAVFFNSPLISLNNPLDFHQLFPNVKFDSLDEIKEQLAEAQTVGGESSQDAIDKVYETYLDTNLNLDAYKTLLTKRCLSALKLMSAEHPEGFILTLPALGCSAFARPFEKCMPKKFEEVLKKMITDNKNALPNLKAIIYTGGEKDKSDEFSRCNGIPFIKTNKTIGTAPQLNEEIFSQFSDELGHQELLNLQIRCGVVCGIAGDPFTRVNNEANKEHTATHEAAVSACTTIPSVATGCEGEMRILKNNLIFYGPKEKKFWGYCFTGEGSTVNYAHITTSENISRSVRPLYAMAAELANTTLTSENAALIKTRLCGVYLAITKSTHAQDKKLKNQLQSYFPLKVIEKYRRDNNDIVTVQNCLAQLSSLRTVNINAKREIENKLTNYLNKSTPLVDFTKLVDELDQLGNELKKKEKISMFGHHRLRHFVEAISKDLKKLPEYKPSSIPEILYLL